MIIYISELECSSILDFTITIIQIIKNEGHEISTLVGRFFLNWSSTRRIRTYPKLGMFHTIHQSRI